ncbi:826_t:CDS:2 [Racocetra fulgida]|uniref:826_t:CDS:1 n=1 Tax=Racocetra fulgida TaxID=60492 RepID=A0A9N8ZL87_9GLOM|nr:826_t:CDS:2 [Racocetra fulgida]
MNSKFYKPFPVPKENGETVLQCRNGTYYDEVSHSSILSQLASFTSIAVDWWLYYFEKSGEQNCDSKNPDESNSEKLDEDNKNNRTVTFLKDSEKPDKENKKTRTGSFLQENNYYYKRQSNYEWIKHFIVAVSFVESILIIIYDVVQINDEKQQKQPANVIPKKVAFFIIFISIIQVYFEYALYCTPKGADSIFFFVLTTILTRSISSFFSNDNFKDIRVKDIEHYGIKNLDLKKGTYKFVFLRILQKDKISDYLGHQRLYVQVNDNDEKMQKYVENLQNFYRYKEYKAVKDIYKQLTEKLGGRKKRCYHELFHDSIINKIIKSNISAKCKDGTCTFQREGHTRININTKENHFIQIKTIDGKEIDETQITGDPTKGNLKIDDIQITGDPTTGNHNIPIQNHNDNIQKIDENIYNNTFEEIIFEKFKNPVGITHIFDRYYNIVDNELNVPGTKIIAKHLSENNAKVYANVLEMGYFQYFVYSHRAFKDKTKDKDNQKNSNQYKKEDIEISYDKHTIVFKNSKVKWFVIPEFGTSNYIRDNDDACEREYKECIAIQKILNNLEHE